MYPPFTLYRHPMCVERITEIAGVVLSFDPKPIQGDWNGAGAHTNYSTKSMRNDGGYEVIKKAIEKLGLKHKEHIAAYGEGNEHRLIGRHETADINTSLCGHFYDCRDHHPLETMRPQSGPPFS